MKQEIKKCKFPGCNEIAGHKYYTAWCQYHGELKRKASRLKYEVTHPDHKFRSKVCPLCYTSFKGYSSVTYCPVCREKIRLSKQNDTKYTATKRNGVRIDEHRRIAKQVGAIAQKNDVVHHMDGNKANNDPSNLVVLSLADHGRLHAHLRVEQLRQPDKTIAQLSWEFIWQNFVPYCFCNEVPGYHYPLSDLED